MEPMVPSPAAPSGGPESEPAPGPMPTSEAVPVFHLDTAAFEAAPALAPASLANPETEPIQPVRPRPPRRTSGRADLLVVFSGKGGVGKSMIATNLAIALAAEGGRVAVVDLDLQFGDVAVMLHTESHPTAIDALAPQGEQVEGEFIEEVMAVGPEGVRALLAPASPEFADLVNTASLRSILRELAKGYDHVVVDTPAHLEERNLEAIEMADQIIVVSSFNLASIKDTKVTLKLLQSLGIAKDRLCVVLNQTSAKASFSRAEVEESLRFRVVTVLPFEPRLDDSLDSGRPLITTEPKSELSRQLRVLAGHITGEGAGASSPEPERPRSRPNRRRFSLGRG
jgi:pilus assembly protein CpaE